MSRINTIRNENKLVETKAGFFADYFTFYTSLIGLFYETELENPLSLVDKILFQIEAKYLGRKGQYISNYLNHDYFVNDRFLKLFPSYHLLKKNIKQFKQISGNNENEKDKNRIKWIKSNTAFTTNLINFRQELKTSMIHETLNRLISFFICPHELKQHIGAIKYFTKILVTEAFFSNRNKNEIQNVFDRILSKDPRTFPFPDNISSDVEKEEFLQRIDFKKQFEGLINFVNEKPENGFIILKVYGAYLEGDASFKYNQVEFVSSKNKKLQFLKQKINSLDKHTKKVFFNGKNYLLALVPVSIYNNKPPLSIAIKILQNEIMFLSLILNRSLAIEIDSYLHTKDFKNCGWRGGLNNGIKKIEKHELEALQDNPFIFLKNYIGPSANHIFRHEQTFINASLSNNVEQFWRYIENIFSFKKSISDQIDIVSSLLLLNERPLRKNYAIQYLFRITIPWEIDYAKLGLTAEMFISLRNGINSSAGKYFYEKINYPFLNELKRIQMTRHTKKRYIEIKRYYTRIFLELYEIRNSIVHKNLINERADIKLKIMAPIILFRLRNILFSIIKKSPNSEFEVLINNAMIKANKLI